MGSTPWVLAILAVAAAALPVHGADGPAYRTLEPAFPKSLREAATVDVNGDGLIDLVTVSAAGERRTFHVFTQKKNVGFAAKADHILPVPSDAAAFTAVDIGGGPGADLLWLTAQSVCAYLDVTGAGVPKVTVLYRVRTFFRFAAVDNICRLDFARDLNGDGRADLLLPQGQGYLVAFQTGRSVFDRVSAIRIAGKAGIRSHTNPVFESTFVTLSSKLPALVPSDFNGDGVVDLIARKGSFLKVFLQDRLRGFPLEASLSARLPFLDRPDGTEKDLFERKVLRMTDVNKDARADLVYIATSGKVGLFSTLKTTYSLFLGRKGAFYSEVPDVILHLPGVALRPEFIDYDGDRDLDLLVTSVRTDLFKGIKSAVVKEVSVSTFLFLAGKDGRWARRPAFEEVVVFPTAMIDRGEIAPRALFGGDFNGDGARDKVTVENGDTLAVYPGRVTDGGFAFAEEATLRVKAAVSADLEVLDLNGDGLSDVLFFHTDKVSVVLSKP